MTTYKSVTIFINNIVVSVVGLVDIQVEVKRLEVIVGILHHDVIVLHNQQQLEVAKALLHFTSCHAISDRVRLCTT
jgi:hypothetical protein